MGACAGSIGGTAPGRRRSAQEPLFCRTLDPTGWGDHTGNDFGDASCTLDQRSATNAVVSAGNGGIPSDENSHVCVEVLSWRLPLLKHALWLRSMPTVARIRPAEFTSSPPTATSRRQSRRV